MAYQINKTNGSVLVNLQDGTRDTTSTSLTLVGKSFPGYGESFNENFVRLLENFANNSEPANKLVGQCWYDTGSGQLKFYNGTIFKATGAITVASSAPTSNARGDLWFKNTTDQLYVYSGTGFKLIGPAIASTSGKTGIDLANETDTSDNTRSIAVLSVNNQEVGIFSDAEFDIKDGVERLGYADATVRRGLTLKDRTDGTGAVLRANVLSASSLSSGRVVFVDSNKNLVDSSKFTFDSVTGNITITGKLTASSIESTGGTGITADSAQVSLAADSDLGYITFVGGTSGEQLVRVNSALKFQNRTITVPHIIVETSTTLGSITKSGASGSGDVGQSSNRFGTIYATTFNGISSQAQYADLAEKYLTDAEYEPGTVVVIGGDKECTVSLTEHDKKVLGVISTAPAYLMNNDTAGQPIALRGRVPCKVVGVVRKGDLLATSGVAGHAQVCAEEYENGPAVFAKALEDKLSEDTGTIEVLIL